MTIKALVATLALTASVTIACADPIEDFYRGRQIQLIIGVGEGGGYDLSARRRFERGYLSMCHVHEEVRYSYDPGGPASSL